MSRTAFGDRYFRKVEFGAVTPWTCVLFDHRLGEEGADGWRGCRRDGCSFKQKVSRL